MSYSDVTDRELENGVFTSRASEEEKKKLGDAVAPEFTCGLI